MNLEQHGRNQKKREPTNSFVPGLEPSLQAALGP